MHATLAGPTEDNGGDQDSSRRAALPVSDRAVFGRRAFVAGGAAGALMPIAGRADAAKGGPRFLWGASTAAHQIEGGNVNSDDWVLEHIPATYFKEPSGDACDSYQRWREDLALSKLGGHNAYRFSVEWARIEPERGEISRANLDHYRRICGALRDAGIAPVVTFHHFTSPRWIAATGGWETPETADRYARYAGLVATAIGDLVEWGCTMNEPNAQVTSQVVKNGKPWDNELLVLAQAARAVGSDRFGAYFLGNAFKVRDVCFDAHAKGREAIKAAAPRMKLGLTLALQQLSPGPGGEALYKRIRDNARLPFYEVARKDDFVGVQTYNRGRTGPDGYLSNKGAEIVDMWGHDCSPGALAMVAEEAHGASGVPILVTENGLNTTDDALRIRHLRASVAGLAQRIDQGLPVLGYLHWSLLDNFEWSSGYTPRYGLVAVDLRTFARTPKPSLAAYRGLIAEMQRAHPWA